MVEGAALLVDEVLPARPIRQWVLTVPFPLRSLFAAYPALMSRVLGIVTRTISTHLARQAGFTKKEAPSGAVTLIQRLGSALNLNIQFLCAWKHECRGRRDAQERPVTYRVAVGPQKGRKVFTLQTLPPQP